MFCIVGVQLCNTAYAVVHLRKVKILLICIMQCMHLITSLVELKSFNCHGVPV